MTEQVRRAGRLNLIEQQLRNHPQGRTVRELSESLDYSMRTIQRDLNVLESEMGVPLVLEGRRWKTMPGSTPVGTVRFTLQEARVIFLATRLYLRHTGRSDPDGIAALQKLAGALPPALADYLAAAVHQLKALPAPGASLAVIRNLTQAWAEGRRVTLRYRSQRGRRIRQTTLDPYLIEPTSSVSATYVIGFSHAHGQVRTFKIDRIVSADISDETFEPGNIQALLAQISHSWGVVFNGEEERRIVIDFTPAVADRVGETTWHPSQRLTVLDGGGVRLELSLPSLLEFVPWVRSWGADACVVAPDELRQEVSESFRAAAAQYA